MAIKPWKDQNIGSVWATDVCQNMTSSPTFQKDKNLKGLHRKTTVPQTWNQTQLLVFRWHVNIERIDSDTSVFAMIQIQQNVRLAFPCMQLVSSYYYYHYYHRYYHYYYLKSCNPKQKKWHYQVFVRIFKVWII